MITGRDAPPELVEIADTVTEMTMVKHAYEQGHPRHEGHRVLSAPTPPSSAAPRTGASAALAALAWRLAARMRAASTAPVGGGIGLRDWVLNVQVPPDYAPPRRRGARGRGRATRSACAAPASGC